jgi:hypothetical protein
MKVHILSPFHSHVVHMRLRESSLEQRAERGPHSQRSPRILDQARTFLWAHTLFRRGLTHFFFGIHVYC